MNAVITFFPVGNGDMTLIQLESGRSVLIDINIRASTEDGVRDVLADLRARLKKDGKGRHYVDAMLLTHPDQDHCRGMVDHFHMGPLADYPEPRRRRRRQDRHPRDVVVPDGLQASIERAQAVHGRPSMGDGSRRRAKLFKASRQRSWATASRSWARTRATRPTTLEPCW